MNLFSFTVLAFGSLLLAGCLVNPGQPENVTVGNATVASSPNPSMGVPMRPLTDSAAMTVKVLEVYPESANVEVLQVVSYSPDARDGTVKIAVGDVRNFTFQWGTQPTVVDLPPIGASANDVRQSGVTIGSVLNVNASISGNAWIVYGYEQLA